MGDPRLDGENLSGGGLDGPVIFVDQPRTREGGDVVHVGVLRRPGCERTHRDGRFAARKR